MSEKKKTLILIVIFVLLVVAFLPIPKSPALDGGTREFTALTYKIVKWHRATAQMNEAGTFTSTTYKKTAVYWLPDNFKSLDELWQIEQGK